MEGMDFEGFLIDWYEKNKRLLPWRKKDPSFYEVLISETMLQQTQVKKVLPYYSRFLERYPTLKALSLALEEDVLKLWEGLGYYSRCRNLLKTARALKERSFSIPETMEGLLALPGIGEYTANAILALYFHRKAIAVDGNLIRVFSRLSECSLTEEKERKKACREYFLTKLSKTDPSSFNQALMDLGELVCLPNKQPLCSSCPLSSFCRSYQNKTTSLYPKKKAANKRKSVFLTVFLIEQDGLFIIRKRKEKGLLASLYEFPNAEGRLSQEEVQEYLERKAFPVSKVAFLGNGKHVFSHIVWEMRAYHVLLKAKTTIDNGLWATKTEIDTIYAIPSAFSFVKKKLN